MTDAGSELRAYLAERDAPCPGCTYNLRGVTGDECPECGTRIELGLVDRSLRKLLWWFVFICSATIGIAESLNGFTGLAFASDTYGYPTTTGSWLSWISVAGQASVGVVAAVCAALLLCGPRRAGRRHLRIMLILASLYGSGWMVNAVFWTGRWWGWW
jgi:hypothetical protein